MARIYCTLLLICLHGLAKAQDVNKTLIGSKIDPYHTKDGGYGYLLHSTPTCKVWWAEGAYKVMRDAPLPTSTAKDVHLQSAKNEFESYILVVNPQKRLEHFRVQPTALVHESGYKIGTDLITVRKVEYVNVTKPTDAYSFEGWWPDPLPLYQQSETLMPSENQPFWITVKVPNDAPAGQYTGEVLLSAHGFAHTVPVKWQVWDFALPQMPTMRSGFGLDMKSVKEYDNLKTVAEERTVFDYYMEAFRDYKIAPYNPFEYSPIVETVKGVAWQGGFFDSKEKYEGNYAYKLTDNTASANTEGSIRALIPIQPASTYYLHWMSKSKADKQPYVVGVECYNAEKTLISFENRLDIFTGETQWKGDTLPLGQFNEEVRFIKIRLFPSSRTRTGEHTGTVWFDNVRLINQTTKQNELPVGDFEVNVNDVDIQLDFTAFNKAGKRYLDEFGFAGYHLPLKGLGSGTYYSRENGVFEGFEQGTVEYNKLMERYLGQMQANLEKNGWLGKEYVYWFDEPNEVDYAFVRETNALIKKYAPKITTFLTEHVAGQDISDVTDISCTIWHKLNHDKIKKMNEKGLQYWSYLCCWPKSPWLSEFIDHDAINLRMWLWGSYKHQLKGILVWQTTYWNSEEASPQGSLQNPWEQAMSFVTGYGWPTGKQTIWGNGDGRFFYPLNRNPNSDAATHIGKPVPSVRLELVRDGIEDYEYFTLLEKAIQHASEKKKKVAQTAKQWLTIPDRIYADEKTYSKNPKDLLEHRRKLAEYIVLLKD